MHETTDILVIGSGAGGAPIALEMSRAGFDVVVLEKGPRYSRDEFRLDDIRTVTEPNQFVPDVRDEPHVLCHDDGRRELTTLGWIASCVGGGTAHMGGSFFGSTRTIFRFRTGHGVSKVSTTGRTTTTALEPYYAKAEAGSGRVWPAGANPFRKGSIAPYPMPPLDAHWLAPDMPMRAAGARDASRFRRPARSISVPLLAGPRAPFADFCAPDSAVRWERAAARSRRSSREPRLTGRCRDTGADHGPRDYRRWPRPRDRLRLLRREWRRRAIRAPSSASAARQSNRLACSCTRDRGSFPTDSPTARVSLAGTFSSMSTSDGAGSARTLRRRRCSAIAGFQPSVADHSSFPDWRIVVGEGRHAAIHVRACRGPIFDRLRRVLPRAMPTWSSGQAVEAAAARTLRRADRGRHGDLSRLHPERLHVRHARPGRHGHGGLPVARLHVVTVRSSSPAGPGSPRTAPRARGDGRHGDAGDGGHQQRDDARHLPRRPGRAPSVLNAFCQAHEVPNLFVVDGSFMPTSGGVPTTLTIVANSFRTADHIRDQARQGGLC